VAARKLLLLLVLPLSLACGARAEPEAARTADTDRAWAEYVRSAPEYRPVSAPQGPDRWDTWLYMPWRYRWTIGTGEEGGRFAREYAINGGMTDHGKGPLEWLERWGLRFYNDHTAGKGALFLLPSPGREEALRDPRAVRPRPLDDALRRELQETISRNVRAVRGSPMRVAYALDDEISWGVLARPAAWRVHADDDAYQAWLDRYYGSGGAAPRAQWVTPEAAFAQLDRPLSEIDLSPLLDRLTYNDSVFANFVGDLVEHCQREDPSTPCGFVGGQGPGAWGGYDWAKLARKVRFVEAYDLGSAQEVLRSLAPDIPRVTTHFHDDRRGAANDSWLAWRYFAHGNRGMIGWVDESWFDAAQPRPWLGRFRDTLRELGGVQGPKMRGARWLHDGVAIYYSHPSVQVSWVLDAEAHGKTWPNRNADHRLGTSHNVRKAWELLLNDAGLQYDFLSYDRVIAAGIPAEYRVLILPACYALSQAEADRIAAFAESGGTVIADFACGLFDPHGRGRARGVLDGLFGVEHDGRETRRDFFGGRLWVETDQDAGFSFTRYRELLTTVEPRLHQGYAVAERRLPVGTSRKAGRGRAVYLNLSPQRYLQDREEGTEAAASEERRRPFLEPIRAAGVAPWLEVVDPRTGRRLPGLEVTAWSKKKRTLVFVLQNVPVASSPTGGGGAVGLAAGPLPIEVRLAGPVRDAVDERTGKRLGDGRGFRFVLDQAEAVFFSFAGKPPKSAQASTVP
jgi:hypothetical protein